MPPGPIAQTAAAISAAAVAAPPRCGAVRVVCVDGPAGSGKTTLADLLAADLATHGTGCAVVHLDDLYEGWSQPLGAPLAARIEAWLLVPWRDGLPGRHPRYYWGSGRFTQWVEVPAAPVVVLEGCGSASQAIRAMASLVVWVEAESEVRLARGLERDGAGMTQEWIRWQASEQEHFERDGTRAAADVVVRT